MTEVFISYRRDDTGDMAGHLATKLRLLPQKPQVFFDVDGIPYGQDFLDRIMGVISRSDVVVVLIGGAWRGVRTDGARILDDDDVVRAEVALALSSRRRIIPVLYNGARMPTAAELPENLSELPRINAIEIRRNFFNRDIEILFDAIWGGNRERPGTPVVDRIGRVAGRALAGATIAGALMVGGLMVFNATMGGSLDQLVGGRAEASVLVAAGILLAGACAGVWWPRPRRV